MLYMFVSKRNGKFVIFQAIYRKSLIVFILIKKDSLIKKIIDPIYPNISYIIVDVDSILIKLFYFSLQEARVQSSASKVAELALEVAIA